MHRRGAQPQAYTSPCVAFGLNLGSSQNEHPMQETIVLIGQKTIGKCVVCVGGFENKFNKIQ